MTYRGDTSGTVGKYQMLWDTSGTVGKYDILWGCLRHSGLTIVDIPHVVDIADMEYNEHLVG